MATVLLVEDDADQLQLRTLIFERSGHTVRAARTATEALALVAGSDVIVMDLRIPQLEDGLWLISSAGSASCIIVLTGDTGGLNLDVDLQLQKPCPSRVLLDAVARLAK